MEELKLSLTEAINADPPLSVEEIIEMIQQKRKEQELPETEVIQVGLSTLVKSTPSKTLQVGENDYSGLFIERIIRSACM